MKYNKLAILLAMALSFVAVSCKKDIVQKPLYPTNVGEEYIEVTVDSLAFLGRGGSMSFTVSASYDVTVTADEWITLSSLTLPGDKREYVLTATTSANKGDGAKDREGRIYIKTANLEEEIVVSQPFYNRPEIPNPIKTAEEFKFFIEEGAPYIESGEVVAIASDIDMKDVTIANSAEYFNGVLEGAGCTIRNMSGSLPLIAKLNEGASISNLAIAGEYTIGSTADEVIFGPFVGLNFGTVAGCVNEANITANGDYVNKVYLGGIAGYTKSGDVTACVNKGKISYAATSSTANAYLGGITAYSFGNVTDCETYGPIRGEASSFSAVYFIGGISPRHEAGALTGNIVHKEAKVYTNENSSTGKSYIGGVIGYLEGAPATGKNKLFADVEVNLKVEAYVGGLQGWQAKVDNSSMPNATLFEGSVVNSNITAYTPGQGKNGNNPCYSAGFVTGRFSGQKGRATTLHYGNADDPIKISGSITCLKTKTKSIATAKDYQALLDGDGSVTSVNAGAITETDYNTIAYEVVGDGQEGPAEDLIVKTGSVKLSVPCDGGDGSFSVRGNYSMTVKSETPWIKVSNGQKDKTTGELVFVEELTIEGDGSYYDVIVRGEANDHTYAREGKVTISMPMGSTEIVTVAQEGNMTIPESLVVSVDTIAADPVGTTSSMFTVTTNYEATLTADADWVTISPATVPGDETTHSVSVLCSKNQSGATRNCTITVALVKGMKKTIALSQEKFVYIPKAEIGNVNDFLDFMTYGNDAEIYPSTFEVKLTADIDLKNKTVGMIDNFNGWFNGQGHCLKNIKSDVPVFGVNKGKIENVVLDSSCAFELDPAKAPSSSSAIWTGALCGNSDPGTISGCTNKASITMTANPTKQCFIGGIAGRSASSVEIKDCVNKGAVTIKPAAAVSAIEFRIAGVVAGSNGSMTNCVNDAPIEFSPADLSGKGFYLGGVAAYLTEKPMKNCVNTQKGKVTFNPAAYSGSTQSYVGGLLGYIDKKTTVDDSKNFGDVKVTANHKSIATGGLVGWIKAGAAGFVLFNNCVVNCDVTAVTTGESAYGSANTLVSAGLIIGSKKASDGVTCDISSVGNEVKVSGSVTVFGGTSTTVTADNYTNYLMGNGEKSNLFGGSTKFNFYTKYEVVTKE